MSKTNFIVFVIVSIGTFIFGYYMQRTTKRILELGKEKLSKVIHIEKIQRKRRGSRTMLEDTEYQFKYKADDKEWVGKYYQKMDKPALIDEDTEVGDTIMIKYDPVSPKNYILKSEEDLVKDRGKWFMLMGVLVLAFTIFLYFT